jgi:hypothetical protein
VADVGDVVADPRLLDSGASASWQTSSKRWASGEISPTPKVYALSAIRPSSVTPRSIEMMSPAAAT